MNYSIERPIFVENGKTENHKHYLAVKTWLVAEFLNSDDANKFVLDYRVSKGCPEPDHFSCKNADGTRTAAGSYGKKFGKTLIDTPVNVFETTKHGQTLTAIFEEKEDAELFVSKNSDRDFVVVENE